MSDSIVYLGQDNSEFVIDSRTGRASISERAGARLLKVASSAVYKARKKLGIEGELARIPTAGGLQGARLLSAKDFYKLAERFNPELAEAMLEMGANSYLLYAAGYQPPVVQIEKYAPPTQLELAISFLKQAQLEAATANLPGLAKINADLMESQSQPQLPGHFTVFEQLSLNWKPQQVWMMYSTINKRMGSAARLHTATKLKTKNVQVETKNGLRTSQVTKYSTDLIPLFDEIVRQVAIEKKLA